MLMLQGGGGEGLCACDIIAVKPTNDQAIQKKKKEPLSLAPD